MAAEVLKSEPETANEAAKQAEISEHARLITSTRNEGEPRRQGPGTRGGREMECYNCKGFGHRAADCRNVKAHRIGPEICQGEARNITPPSLCKPCAEKVYNPRCVAEINGIKANAIRDTGAMYTVVARKFIRPNDYTGEKIKVVLASGVETVLPIARVKITSPFVVGQLQVLVMEKPAEDILIGNITRNGEGASEYRIPVYANTITVSAVQTRAQKKKEELDPSALGRCGDIKLDASTKDIIEMQNTDETLARAREMCTSGKEVVTNHGEISYIMKGGILMRKYKNKKTEATQLCVPKQMRSTILALAHDIPMAGHMGIGKTSDRVTSSFFWPGMFGDVKRFVQSCSQCQRTVDRGRVPKVPFVRRPLMSEPFQKVAMDIIGPIKPLSAVVEAIPGSENKLADYLSRLPEDQQQDHEKDCGGIEKTLEQTSSGQEKSVKSLKPSSRSEDDVKRQEERRFKTERQDHIKPTAKPFMPKKGFIFEEKPGSVFNCDPRDSMAHCVSADFAMSRGIAVQFKNTFQKVQHLKNQGKGVGEVAILEWDGTFIYYLVTKERFYEKPTHDSLRQALEEMCIHMVQHGVHTVAMPRLGTGLDRLNWKDVSRILCEVFQNTCITIKVYDGEC